LKKNLQIRVPGQGRLAISRLRVPNLDSFVPAATGDLFSIGAPRHWCDPEITRSQYTNQQKQRGKNLKKTYKFECPVSVDLQSPDCESQILIVLSLLPLAICFPSGLHATEFTLYLWEVSTRINRNQEEKLGEKLTRPSARSLGTRKRTFGNLLHLRLFQACIYQQKVTYSRDLSYRTQKRNKFFLLLF